MPHTSAIPESATDVQAELRHILCSRPFAAARRSQRFLGYLVDHSLTQPAQPIKEYSIALDVFERSASYDPSVDATVRVEAGRLRSRLRDYYADEGAGAPFILEVPKGAYRVVVRSRTPVAEASPEPPAPTTKQPRVRLWPVLLLAFASGSLLGLLTRTRKSSAHPDRLNL